MVHVMGETEMVNTPSTATCALGGSSYPLSVMTTAHPYDDLTVTMSMYELDADVEDDVD